MASQGWDFEIQNESGVWIGLSIAPTFASAYGSVSAEPGSPMPKTFHDILAASDSDAPVSETFESDVQESWGGGVGISYAWAPGVFTRPIGRNEGTETRSGYACPAGKVTELAIPAPESGAIRQIVQYGDDLFFAQEGTVTQPGRVLRIVSPYTAVTASLTLAAPGRYCRGLVVADNGSGALRVYAMCSDGGVQNGEMYSWDGAAWTGPVAMGAANGRGESVKVEWRGQDGIRNNVIFTQAGPRQVAWTRPNADPMAGTASWIEAVKINTTGQIRSLTASRGHVFVGTDDNVYDIDQVGNTVSLLRYGAIELGNGYAMEYLDGSVFYARGDGLAKVNVESAVPMLQEDQGQCRPGWLTGAEIPPGYTTALTSDDGCLINATFDQVTRRSLIYWGKARATVQVVRTPNPMVWWGPECVFETDLRVTRMLPASLGNKRLWIAAIGDAAGPTRLFWQSLPLAGDPAQDQLVNGPHRFGGENPAAGQVNPYARIYSLRKTFKDKASRTDLNALTFGTTGLGGGTQLLAYTRADAERNSNTWGTPQAVTTGPVQTLTPPITNGYSIQQRIDFVSGTDSTPAFLDLWRTTFFKIVPDVNVRTLDILYGDSVNIANARESTYDPDQITGWLQALADAGTHTTVRSPDGSRWIVRVRQSFPRETTIGTGGRWRKSVRATLQLIKASDAP